MDAIDRGKVDRDKLPIGTVTFVLTDIEGSTRNWESGEEAMRAALRRHDEILGDQIRAHGGRVLTERGEGDSFFAVFARASEAIEAAVDLQLALVAEPWPESAPMQVRMAIHTAEAGTDYRGPDVNRCARLRAIAHGGQVLLSAITAALIRPQPPDGVSLVDLGVHRLRDLTVPERVFQVAHEGLPLDFPPLRSLDAFKHNLPVQLTSFVGRSSELDEVRALLEAHRLVTLTGAGGAGKTRLALQVAADVVEGLPDGAWFVDLAPQTDAESVARGVAEALSITEIPGRALPDVLADGLIEKDLLLLLDNCEHVIEECRRLADRLLRAAPGLRILATSRESLNIAGEVAWRVPSLSLPDVDRPLGVDTLSRCEAVQLFCDRAALHRSGFGLTEGNAAAVAQICHRLDGVPLALELAAARVKLMSPDQIVARLEDRFRLLTGGSSVALPRQQTLRAAVDWSHDLLSEPERILFRRLSVFAGGFHLEAAEEVCTGSDLAGEDILDVLAQLVGKSLVIADAEEDGSVRYRLLEILRQYGREKVEAAVEDVDAGDHHLRYFLGLAERAYGERIDRGPFWLAVLEHEHDNLRAALDWAHGRHPSDELALAGALGWFWFQHTTHLTEGRERLARALLARQGPGPTVARALVGASLLATWQGDTKASHALAEEGLAMSREIGDPLELSVALEAAGWPYFFEGDAEGALKPFEEALALQAEIGNPRSLNRVKSNICQILVSVPDPERAEPLATEVLEEATKLGELRDIHYAHHYLGDCAMSRRQFGLAERRYSQSLRAALNYGNFAEAGVELQGVAMAVAGRGRWEEALRLNAAAEAKMAEVGIDVTGIGFWMDFFHEHIDRARGELVPEVRSSAEEEGRRTGFDATVLLVAGSE